MRSAAERLLESLGISGEFGSTQCGHQYVIVRRGPQHRKIFFAGSNGRDQSAMKKMLSFIRRMVAEIS